MKISFMGKCLVMLAITKTIIGVFEFLSVCVITLVTATLRRGQFNVWRIQVTATRYRDIEKTSGVHLNQRSALIPTVPFKPNCHILS